MTGMEISTNRRSLNDNREQSVRWSARNNQEALRRSTDAELDRWRTGAWASRSGFLWGLRGQG
jgi:hypothetical protein